MRGHTTEVSALHSGSECTVSTGDAELEGMADTLNIAIWNDLDRLMIALKGIS